MAPKTIIGSERIANMIRTRRNELGLTIQEAAEIANVGIKTWCRYENGGSIRRDKCKGICKALNWTSFPNDTSDSNLGLDYYRNSETWSKYIADTFGESAAISFCAGGEILFDEIQQDLEELSKMPAGSHLGQIHFSMLKDMLPPQFLMRYDYDFVYKLRLYLVSLQSVAGTGKSFMPRNVLDELLLNMIVEEAELVMETYNEMEDEYYPSWIYDLIGDSDILFLWSDFYYMEEDNDYHFNNWTRAFSY